MEEEEGGDMEMHQGGDQSSVPHRAVHEDAVFTRSGRDVLSKSCAR